MTYPKIFEHKIGFDTLRNYVKGKCSTKLGMQEVDAMCFSDDYNVVKSRLYAVNEFIHVLQGDDEFALNFVCEQFETVSKIKVQGTFLLQDELYNVYRSLCTISEIASFFARQKSDDIPLYPELSELASGLFPMPNLVTSISRIFDNYGNIRDNATPELLEIKRSLASTMSSVNGLMRRVIGQARMDGYLDKDVMPSVRDGRLVLPVSPMHKRKIKGIVHDESATGKTVFIEPAEVVEANNKIRELENDQKREIIRILTEKTDELRPYVDDIIASLEIIAQLDFIRAKALTALALDAHLPNLNKDVELEWYHAEHPILRLTLQEQGKQVVPLDITLNAENRLLIISGPNAGGKSVCLKTVGINQYMLQCGMLPLAYDNSHFGIFRNIFIELGDEQSIEDDLSTYSSHLTNMKYFVANGDDSTIVLIDEFGGGTEPQIGGAIAQAILHSFNEKRMYGVITTHYQNLKHFAEETEGIINGAMLYDRHHMKPQFKLEIGYPGSSFAVDIARKIGLPQSIISEAEEIVGSDYVRMDKYLLDIARDRKYWEHKRQQIRIRDKKLAELEEKYEDAVSDLNSQRKEIIQQAKHDARQLLAESNAKIEATIHDIKKANAEREKTKAIRRELEKFKQEVQQEDKSAIKGDKSLQRSKRKTEFKPEIVEEIKVGDSVVLDNSNSVGEVISVKDGKAVVSFGMFKTTTDVKRLKKTNRKQTVMKSSSTVNTVVSQSSRERQLNFNPDLDVRGMRVDEATQAVMYFIDDALQFSFKRVRILHGTGNGILRQRLREYLNGLACVTSYRDEHVQFGGAGITIVDLV